MFEVERHGHRYAVLVSRGRPGPPLAGLGANSRLRGSPPVVTQYAADQFVETFELLVRVYSTL